MHPMRGVCDARPATLPQAANDPATLKAAYRFFDTTTFAPGVTVMWNGFQHLIEVAEMSVLCIRTPHMPSFPHPSWQSKRCG